MEKIYAIRFIEEHLGTVSNGEEEIGRYSVIQLNDGEFLVKESQVTMYQKYGKGIAECRFVGYLRDPNEDLKDFEKNTVVTAGIPKYPDMQTRVHGLEETVKEEGDLLYDINQELTILKQEHVELKDRVDQLLANI